MNKPTIIQGELVIDDRGGVGFVNDFNFTDVKRFYVVSNHKQGFIRAWHGHKREGKYVTVINGVALIGAVKIDDWSNPSKDCPPEKYVLSSIKPSILYIPPGYANGFMSLTKNTKVIFYSTLTLEESKGDDYRFNARHWNIWESEER